MLAFTMPLNKSQTLTLDNMILNSEFPMSVQENPLVKEMATHFSILVWEIPWTEEPGGLQCVGSQRAGHD